MSIATLPIEGTKPMKCTAKHAEYDPPIEEFKCPKCDAPCGDFCVDESAEGADPSCEQLHSKDSLICYKCKYVVTGSRFAESLTKLKNLIPCPTCKGHGMVKGSP